jgi:hypothetical protein
MSFLQDAFTDLLAIATTGAGHPAPVTAGD